MKKKPAFILTILFLSLFALACDNDDNDFPSDFPETIRALSEHDFLNDETAFAVPEDGVILTHLEHPEAVHEADTGEQGMDIVPIKYTSDTTHTYCWEDENEDSSHFMTLNDLEGNELLRVDVNGDCVSQFVESGEYEIHLHHDGNSDQVHPIFLIPDNEVNEEVAQVSQTVDQNLQTLLSTNACPGCDLEGATIGFTSNTVTTSGGINPDAPPITTTTIQKHNLSNANLVGANLRGANLRYGNFTGADFTNAVLRNINTGSVILENEANLTDAIFNGAVWKNGNGCQDGSIGSCTQAKFAFISSLNLSGDLLQQANNFENCSAVESGQDAADCICSELAKEAGFSSNYLAWIGGGGSSPSTKFNQASIPYMRTDTLIIADDYDDLIDGQIENPIIYSEKRKEVKPKFNSNTVRSWTAVDSKGDTNSGANCNNWTSDSPTNIGFTGNALTTSSNWTEIVNVEGAITNRCNDDSFDSLRIYCFQQ
ncbi:MAG: pentapeptide repeat-containing protein [Thermodesulfobacteriota bacterium]